MYIIVNPDNTIYLLNLPPVQVNGPTEQELFDKAIHRMTQAGDLTGKQVINYPLPLPDVPLEAMLWNEGTQQVEIDETYIIINWEQALTDLMNLSPAIINLLGNDFIMMQYALTNQDVDLVLELYDESMSHPSITTVLEDAGFDLPTNGNGQNGGQQ